MQKYEPTDTAKNRAHIGSFDEYKKMYDYSVEQPESFWAEQAERISWFKKWNNVWDWDFNSANVKWFEGAKLNACYNCVDRHVIDGYGEKTALIWEGNNPNESQTYTYNDLLEKVQLTANALKNLGVERR